MNIKKIGSIVLGIIVVGGMLQPAEARYGFAQRHPRRAEVLRRDRWERNTIKADRGHLGGHYGQLMREDKAIRRQERAEARANGGHITKGEQRQLNREENHLRREINRDHMGH
jgi:hypothetical protein